jgi:hypothetical protein
MGTTTYAAMRTTAITQIEGLTPTSLASTPFRSHREETDFRTWAEGNKTGALRRFSTQDLGGYDAPEVSNLDLEWRVGTCEVLVAYPNDFRYGPGAEHDQRDIMREDFKAIDDVIGHRGTGNYTDGHMVREEGNPQFEEGENVTLLAITYTYRFWEAV